MTWSFDPRFTDCDDAVSFEADLVRCAIAEMPPISPRQQTHIDNIARLKTQSALMVSKCLDCGLQLAPDSRAKRCLTCYAKNEGIRKAASRVRQKIRRTTASERAKASGWDKPTGPSRYSWE